MIGSNNFYVEVQYSPQAFIQLKIAKCSNDSSNNDKRLLEVIYVQIIVLEYKRNL